MWCFAVGSGGGWKLVVLCGVCDRDVGGGEDQYLTGVDLVKCAVYRCFLGVVCG